MLSIDKKARVLFVFLVLSFLLFNPLVTVGQTVYEPWETLATEHFRLHYPTDYKDWAVDIGGRLESIHDKVTTLTDFDLDEPLQMVLVDPLAQANGGAIPLLNSPRIVLFATYPSPTGGIGYYSNWRDLVVAHEYTHIIHLTRPPRNGWAKFTSHLLPMSPISINSPMWIVEGYAVLLEGKLTGWGRPNGSIRPMFLREMATAGLLPDYSQVNGSDRWASGAYPYLVGSAFTEWIYNREGEESLVHLFKRMTAKKRRSFEEAFKGVYREPPDELYGKFVAEITEKAMKIKREIEEQGVVEGEMFQKIYGSSSPISLSPDGTMMAVVLYPQDGSPKMEIWSLTEEAEKEDEEKKDKDPEDVPDKPSAPAKRKVLHSLPMINGRVPNDPQFLPDGKTVLFSAFMPDGQGNLHPDLFLWKFEEKEIKRLTKQADVRDAFPYDNGKKAIAVRSRYGKSGLVSVNMTDGTITTLIEPSLTRLHVTPAVSPDDTSLALVSHYDKSWHLNIYDLSSMELLHSIGDGREIVAEPAWSSDSRTLYFISDRTGISNAYALSMESHRISRLTNVISGVLSPKPTPDSAQLFYKKFWTKGFNIYKLDLQNNDEQTDLISREATYPLLPPTTFPEVEPFQESTDYSIDTYGWGKQNFTQQSSFGFTPSGDSINYGLRIGDIIGRHETVILGGFTFDEGTTGGTLRQRFERLPFEIYSQIYWVREEPKTAFRDGDIKKDVLDLETYGFLLGIQMARGTSRFSWKTGLSGLFSQKEYLSDESNTDFSRSLGQIDFEVNFTQSRNKLFVYEQFSALGQLGQTDEQNWMLSRGEVAVGFGIGGMIVEGRYERAKLHDERHYSEAFTLGGWRSSLIPEQSVANRFQQPALEQGIMAGNEAERLRGSLTLGNNFPLTLYGEHLKSWTGDYDETDPIRLWGAEFAISVPKFPLINIAQSEIRFGIAKIQDDPLDDETATYITLVLLP